MIFKQLFDTKSSTYTYLISSGKGREALIIDPVIENVAEYVNLLKCLKIGNLEFLSCNLKLLIYLHNCLTVSNTYN